MKNQILDSVKNHAIALLKMQYGFVGVAESDDSVILNSSDGQGNDIIIKIESKPE